MRRSLLLPLVLAALAAPPAGASAAETRCPAGSELSWARVQLFRDANCGGGQVVVKAGDQAPDRPDFARFANWDGRTYAVDNTRSSLLIAAGTCVRLFDGRGFSGDQSTNICATGGRLAWNLSRFDDRATSMRVCTTADPGACAPPSASTPAPAPAPAPSRPAPGIRAGDRYVALGDSYSSGVGTRFYDYSRDCLRGSRAYPKLVDVALGTRLVFRACGGAKTGDVLRKQVAFLTPSTRLVTISVGGNDAGFTPVILSCARPWPWTCWGDVDRAERFVRRTLPGRLAKVYAQIRRRSPRATVLVVGYPRIFSERDECNAAARISPGEQRRLNDVADAVAAVTRRQAARFGFRFVDPRAAFTEHGVCSGAEWINGVSKPKEESMHPNIEGNRAYAELVLAAVRR